MSRSHRSRDDYRVGGRGDYDDTTTRRSHHWYRPRNVIAAFLVLVLAVIAALWWYLNGLGDDIRRAPLLPSYSGPPSEGHNYLLLGSDSRADDLRAGARADVIQLVHLSEDYKQAAVIHFPRDLYVPIPGHGKNKINAAYAFGGAPLLVRTIQDYYKINIEHVAQVGFGGFVKVTDIVGGVDVYTKEPGERPTTGAAPSHRAGTTSAAPRPSGSSASASSSPPATSTEASASSSGSPACSGRPPRPRSRSTRSR